MKLLKQVAGNVAKLLSARGSLKSENQLAKKAKVDQGTINDFIGRHKKGLPSDIRLSTLEKISTALEVCPWQLLIPNLPDEVFDKLSKNCSSISADGLTLLLLFESTDQKTRNEISSYATYVVGRGKDTDRRDTAQPEQTKKSGIVH